MSATPRPRPPHGIVIMGARPNRTKFADISMMQGENAMKPIAGLALAGLLLAFSTSSMFAAEPGMRNQPHANELGIWKSYSPRGLYGEFHNYDPVGLMAGALIHTDCSINFTDPDTHKIYCFNSATSQTYFANWPKTYARKAAESLQKIKEQTPTQ